ncbi:F-box protein At3g07870-like [Papaver somniferum]|uniref:F-box protein At3g07870-like n=1 Tax=Papaver somniferum TaxID=3469 RepID=UPI000E6FD735|nr:F-box protein At3g07870-like [Papaver somniferum]XP_026397717.1 F-box protein At3g07870-like [Papaver somniferum]
MFQNQRVQLIHLEYDETNDNEQQLRISKMNHPLISRVHYRCMIFGDDAPFWKIKSLIIGSSNGLICLSIPTDGKFGAFSDPLYICNPVTREYILLPICNEKCQQGRNVFGFGYNDKTNEYKVVRIYYESEEHTEPGQVQVYTLGAGTGWRNKGEIAYASQTNNSHSPGMNADGEVYWLHQGMPRTERGKSNTGRVVAFSLANEMFRLLPTPPYYTTLPSCLKMAVFVYYQIQVLGGCLCFIHKKGYDTINVWSFKKRNDCCSCSSNEKEEDSSNWSLAAAVHLQRGDLVEFFDLTKNGEILYWDDKRTPLSYDPRTASIKELLNDDTAGLDVFETIRHENSFVSLKALGEENVDMFDRIN